MRTKNIISDGIHSNFGGIHRRYKFENGYGASVICHSFSYGGPQGFFELAVLKDGKLCYDTPITNDVVPRLTEIEVDKILEEIERLPIEGGKK